MVPHKFLPLWAWLVVLTCIRIFVTKPYKTSLLRIDTLSLALCKQIYSLAFVATVSHLHFVYIVSLVYYYFLIDLVWLPCTCVGSGSCVHWEGDV